MRSKLWVLAGIALAGSLALIGATQVWITLSLAAGAAASESLSVTGQQLNQSLSPVALAALATAIALTIAGKVFRRILGVLTVLLGVGIIAITINVLRDPGAAVASRLAEVTGLEGSVQAGLVTAIGVSPMVFVTLIAGVLLAIFGLPVLLLGGRWKTAGRKYESDAPTKRVESDEPDRISDWEAQNDGFDPSDSH